MLERDSRNADNHCKLPALDAIQKRSDSHEPGQREQRLTHLHKGDAECHYLRLRMRVQKMLEHVQVCIGSEYVSLYNEQTSPFLDELLSFVL